MRQGLPIKSTREICGVYQKVRAEYYKLPKDRQAAERERLKAKFGEAYYRGTTYGLAAEILNCTMTMVYNATQAARGIDRIALTDKKLADEIWEGKFPAITNRTLRRISNRGVSDADVLVFIECVKRGDFREANRINGKAISKPRPQARSSKETRTRVPLDNVLMNQCTTAVRSMRQLQDMPEYRKEALPKEEKERSIAVLSAWKTAIEQQIKELAN